jgi:hypothetical protein
MNENIASSGVHFPPGVIDGAGRRLRPGNIVRFLDNDLEVLGEVVAWFTDGISLHVNTEDDSDEEWFVRNPFEVFRVDAELGESLTVGEFFIETDGPSSIIIEGVGTRDLIMVADATPNDAGLLPLNSDVTLRDWSQQTLTALFEMESSQRIRILQSSFRAPILERVLQEAVLPRVIDRLVLVATDQTPQHPQDTIYCARILELWMEAHGHVVGKEEPNMSRRWIRHIDIWSVDQLPHVIDAVAFRMKSEIATWVGDSQRVVVVHGGGTPAMNTAVLITAVQYSNAIVRHVQVPEPHKGTGQIQPLIEFDLVDMPELGKALRQDS